MNFPGQSQIKSFLKQTFLAGLIISLPVYAWLRIIFYELPFSFKEDGTIIFKNIFTGWVIFILLKSAFQLILLSAQKMRNILKPLPRPVQEKAVRG